MNKLIFGGLIACILLGLYIFAIITAIQLAPTCQQPCNLPEGIVAIFNLVGGLVSALVIVELAIKKRGQPLGAHLLENPDANNILFKIITFLYVMAWLGFGFASFVAGNIMFPNKVPALTEFGKTWLGLAVAAAYSFFGIKQGE